MDQDLCQGWQENSSQSGLLRRVALSINAPLSEPLSPSSCPRVQGLVGKSLQEANGDGAGSLTPGPGDRTSHQSGAAACSSADFQLSETEYPITPCQSDSTVPAHRRSQANRLQVAIYSSCSERLLRPDPAGTGDSDQGLALASCQNQCQFQENTSRGS